MTWCGGCCVIAEYRKTLRQFVPPPLQGRHNIPSPFGRGLGRGGGQDKKMQQSPSNVGFGNQRLAKPTLLNSLKIKVSPEKAQLIILCFQDDMVFAVVCLIIV